MRTSRTYGADDDQSAHAESVASLGEPTRSETARHRLLCLACGKAIEVGLAGVASLRCHACREAKATLDAELVDLLHQQYA
jgi:hypothetical protein